MYQNDSLLKSELIELISDAQGHLPFKDIEDSVNCIIDQIVEALQNGERVEIRGFGVFSLRKRKAMIGRNPKTGEPVSVPEKYVPRFKPSKLLADNLNTK